METAEEKRATFTPGPWYTYQSHKYVHRHIACKAGKSIAKEVHHANARLIAAAPELLEQCKLFEKVLQVIGDMGYRDEIEGLDSLKWLMRITELREVLAKVEGGEG